ncbi:MAG TPA: hypothetical protein VGF25_22670 [Thermoleophilaceae bacterium]
MDTGLYGERHTPDGTISGSCFGTRADVLGAAAAEEGLLAPVSGGTQVVFSPFDIITLPLTCQAGTPFATALSLADLPATGLGYGPFDLVFDLPAEATSQGKVIQLVRRDVPKEQCPLNSQYSDACTLQIEGTVTFTRTGTHSGQPAPPTPPGDGGDDDDPPTPPVEDEGELLTPLVPGKTARLRGTRAARFTLRCPAGCTVTARVYAAGHSPTAARRRPLATRRLTLAAGRAKRVEIRFGKSARRAIKRSGGIRVELAARPRGGGPEERSAFQLRLRREL